MPYNTRKPAGPESHCVLRKLTYPTGGYTEFDFENHKFFSFTDDDGDYIHDKRRVKTEATGFRIREIVNYTAEGVRRFQNTTVTGKPAPKNTAGKSDATTIQAQANQPSILPFRLI